MTGTLDSRILQIIGLVAGMLLWASLSPIGFFPPSAAAESRGTLTTERDLPYRLIATGHGAAPVAGSELVWILQRGTASREQRGDLGAFALGFVTAQRGILDHFDERGHPSCS